MAANYSRPQTLYVLQRAGLYCLNIDLQDHDGWTPMEIAQWRRDDNLDWSNWSNEPVDKDPLKWFRTFKDFIDSVKAANAFEYYSAFTALANNEIHWDEESAPHSHENRPNIPGSFPIDD